MKREHAPISRWLGIGVALLLVAAAAGVAIAAVPQTDRQRPVAIAQLPADPIEPPTPPPLPRRVVNDLAQGVFHFPLHVGNQWIYEKGDLTGNQSAWRVDVTASEFGDPAGLVLNGYLGDRHVVDYGQGGEITELAAGGQALIWYRLGAEAGTIWKLDLAESPVDCVDGSVAVLASHGEHVVVPAGEFFNAIRVDYKSPCDMGGLVSEWFAEGVGLVKRVENTAWGFATSSLLSAKVGELLLPDHPSGTSLTLDAEVYNATGSGRDPAKLQGLFRMHDQTSNTETWDFLGCVSASWVLVDEQTGAIAASGSVADVTRCAEFGTPPGGDIGGGGGTVPIDTPPEETPAGIYTLMLHGETFNLPIEFAVAYSDGTPLPTGHYYLKMTLDALEHPNGRPSASAHIQVFANP